MPLISDPFETAFFDYLNGNKDAELLVENNKGDDEIMPVRYFFRSIDEMPELEKQALKLCSGKVLDVGAGSGCHSLHLQNNGFDVTGLDIKPGFTEVMQKQGIRKTITKDIRDFKVNDFDTILMLMNGIGFTQTLDQLGEVLKKWRQELKKSAQIILDSTDLLYLYQDEDGSCAIELTENYYGEVVYQVVYKGIKGEPFKWLFVDYSNLSFYAEEAGFRSELIFEDDHSNYLARLY